QTRGNFEARKSGPDTFYVRNDAASGRTAAFAVKGDTLIVGTRDDLVAGALALLRGEKQRAVADETWFTDATAAARASGDLRMVLNMPVVPDDPRFGTYWLQQNIPAMQGYRAAISDLYRDGRQYREERVLLPATAKETTPPGPAAVSELMAWSPPD